jgi:hypothetical protein
MIGDIPAGLIAGELLRFFPGVEGAEVRMVVAARRAAMAAIGKRERTQRRTVVGASGHRCLQKEDFVLGS